ncbi:hypothetical protein L6172_15745 [Thalassospiraceae bacterium SW-3-3]|nr:hypothetical protein L6172_15745 [Thalassospiraceae bacterium SW-3-3]
MPVGGGQVGGSAPEVRLLVKMAVARDVSGRRDASGRRGRIGQRAGGPPVGKVGGSPRCVWTSGWQVVAVAGE